MGCSCAPVCACLCPCDRVEVALVVREEMGHRDVKGALVRRILELEEDGTGLQEELGKRSQNLALLNQHPMKTCLVVVVEKPSVT